MNITFLIGNGFDLNLGLDTQYANFLENYKNPDKEDGRGVRFLKELISDKETESLWSNTEESFGQLTAEFMKKGLNADDYCDSHDDFCEKLANYLEKQQSRIDFEENRNQVIKGFVSVLKSYTNGFRDTEIDDINDIIKPLPGAMCFNFVNFNYTDTLDRCISIAEKERTFLGSREYKSTVYGNYIEKSIHVHGTTKKSMVFGVNDISQLSDCTLFDNYGDEYISSVIKKQTNEINRENTDKKTFDIIKSSDLIYIYGMSIGSTDKLWWERICQVMKDKKHLQLIIHDYDAPKSELTMRLARTNEKKFRLKFLNYSDIEEHEKEEIASRIHIDSSNIFSGLKDMAAKSKQLVSPVPALV